MAKEASMSLLFLVFFCSGTLVGFSYGVREDTASPTFLQRNKISRSRIRFPVTDHNSLNTLSTNYDVVSKYLEATPQITKGIVALYAEVHKTEDVAQKEMFFPLSQREKLSKVHIRRTLDETNNSPTTVFPTSPTSATPAVITVPSTTSPASVPTTVPSTTPVPPLSPTNPTNSPPPFTVPGSTPVTNPAASYPPPSGSTVPVTNPLSPPASSTNAPATSTQGQSWCVAKSGVSETTLQSALDYACSKGTVDCSQIQQGGSCYNPNSIQNHASFAFNSYYQKNPAPTSCDFGGVATIVNTNPSSGSCIFPSSSSSSSAAAGTSGSGISPSAFGSQSPPPGVDTSHSAALRPFLGFMVVVISLVTGRLSMKQ